jgi:hypothetical protein
MARPPAWAATLAAAREEASFAVQLYNDSARPRTFEGFVIHMHIAWLYLLHARFERDGVDYRYRDRDDPRKFVKVDGEYKRWELSRSAEQRWPEADHAVRKNIEFFIALRNRIEHRRARSSRYLALAVSGHAQALLLNFEDELTSTFGVAHSMATKLRFPVFVGTFTTEGEASLREYQKKLPADLRRFIAEFSHGMPEALSSDRRFELRLRVVLQAAQRGEGDLAIQFSRWDDMTEAQKQAAVELSKHGMTIVREQKRPVTGVGLIKPAEAERRVAAAIPYKFNSNHFLRARKIKRVRPEKVDKHPERTDEKYCIYDEFSREYGYTDAWISYLVTKCSSEKGFREATGREPELKTNTRETTSNQSPPGDVGVSAGGDHAGSIGRLGNSS